VLHISYDHLNALVAHARSEDPNECCGILVGSDDTVMAAYRISNIAKSPYRYLMDSQEFLDADIKTEKMGWEFLAFYHSHTHSQAYPSDTDVRMAQQSGYHDVYYVLISLEDNDDPDIRVFLINERGDITEVNYEIASLR